MPSINRVLLAGLVAERPVISKTTHGVLRATFQISTRHHRNDEVGHEATTLQLHPCIAYAKQAERAVCLFPPVILLVEGRLQSLERPGANHGTSETVVIVSTLLVVDRPDEHPDDDQPASGL